MKIGELTHTEETNNHTILDSGLPLSKENTDFDTIKDHDHEDNRVSSNRVRKACESCRSKKVKCDGASPCLKCIGCTESMEAARERCVYNYEIKKKPSTSNRTSNRQIFSLLNEKLQYLETMLNEIQESNSKLLEFQKKGTPVGQSVWNPETPNKVDGPTLVKSKHLIDVQKENADSGETNKLSGYGQHLPESDVSYDDLLQKKPPFGGKRKVHFESHRVQKPSTKSTSARRGSEKQDVIGFLHENEEAQKYMMRNKNCFTLFTKDGFDWMSKKIDSSECEFIYARISKLNELLRKDNELFIQDVFQRVEAPTLVKPPADMLEFLLQQMEITMKCSVPMLCFRSTQFLIERYKNELSVLHEGSLFLLNTMFLLTCSIVKGDQQLRGEVSVKDIEFWENVYLLNCISFYQNMTLKNIHLRPSNEIIPCLQALCLLCAYLRNSASPKVCVLIGATAIVLAQELRLNDPKVINSLPTMEERVECRLLWLNCFALDATLSTWFGKPNAISLNQFSVFDKQCYIEMAESVDLNLDVALFEPGKKRQLYAAASNTVLGYYFIFFDLSFMLSKLKALAYKDILSVQNETKDLNQIAKDVECINEKVDAFLFDIKFCLKLDSDCSLAGFKERLDIIEAHNITGFASLKTLFFNLVLELQTLRLIYGSKVLPTPSQLDTFTIPEHLKLNTVKQMEICDMVFTEAWLQMNASDVLFPFVSSYFVGATIALKHKEYFSENIKLFIKVLKKFISLARQDGFIDPLKWSVVAIYCISLTRILFLRYPAEIAALGILENEKTLVSNFKFFFHRVIDLSKTLNKTVAESNAVRRQAGRPMFTHDVGMSATFDELLDLFPSDFGFEGFEFNSTDTPNSSKTSKSKLDQNISDFHSRNSSLGTQPSSIRSSLSESEQFAQTFGNGARNSVPPSPFSRHSVFPKFSLAPLVHVEQKPQRNNCFPTVQNTDILDSSPGTPANSKSVSNTFQIPEALRDMYLDDLFGANNYNFLEFLDDEMFKQANMTKK